VKVEEDLSGFVKIADILEFCEKNEYRYIRHATIRENHVAFCSELGKEKSKIVAFRVQDSNSILLMEKSG
jgi:hypothetical protein